MMLVTGTGRTGILIQSSIASSSCSVWLSDLSYYCLSWVLDSLYFKTYWTLVWSEVSIQWVPLPTSAQAFSSTARMSRDVSSQFHFVEIWISLRSSRKLPVCRHNFIIPSFISPLHAYPRVRSELRYLHWAIWQRSTSSLLDKVRSYVLFRVCHSSPLKNEAINLTVPVPSCLRRIIAAQKLHLKCPFCRASFTAGSVVRLCIDIDDVEPVPPAPPEPILIVSPQPNTPATVIEEIERLEEAFSRLGQPQTTSPMEFKRQLRNYITDLWSVLHCTPEDPYLVRRLTLTCYACWSFL